MQIQISHSMYIHMPNPTTYIVINTTQALK